MNADTSNFSFGIDESFQKCKYIFPTFASFRDRNFHNWQVSDKAKHDQLLLKLKSGLIIYVWDWLLLSCIRCRPLVVWLRRN